MESKFELRIKSTSLEPIPEETLPRISQMIPKSTETMQRDQEYQQYYNQLLSPEKQRIEIVYEMLVFNNKLKRISHNGPCIMGKCTEYGWMWRGSIASHCKQTQN